MNFDLGEDGQFVGGHLSKVGTRKDILINQAYTNAVLSAAMQARGMVDATGILAELGIDDPTSRNYFNRHLRKASVEEELKNTCARIALQEVGCQLAGADITMKTLCSEAFFFLSYI